MILVTSIVLRIAFALGLVTALGASFSDRISPDLKRIGVTTAVVTGLALLGLRIGLRVWMPDRVPSFSG